MKTLYLVLLGLLILFAAMPVYCAEVGGLPAKNGFELAFKSDSSERDIELKSPFIVWQDSGSSEGGGYSSSWSEEVKINSFDAVEKTQASYFKACYTFLFLDEALQIFGKIGSVSGGQNWSNIEIEEYYNSEYDYDGGYYEYHNKNAYWVKNMPETPVSPRWSASFGSYYGLGVKCAHKMDSGVKIGMGLQYTVSKFKKDATISKDEGSGGYDYDSGDYWYRTSYASSSTTTIADYETAEPQISIIASKEFDKFGIYGGMTYSIYQGKAKGNTKYSYQESYEDSYGNESEDSEESSNDFSFKTKSSRNLGLFLGGEYNLTENFGLNTEIAVGNEQRLTVGGLYKF